MNDKQDRYQMSKELLIRIVAKHLNQCKGIQIRG